MPLFWANRQFTIKYKYEIPLRYQFNVQVKLADLSGVLWRRLAPVAPQCDDRCFQKVKTQFLPDEGDCLRVLLTGLIGHLCCNPPE